MTVYEVLETYCKNCAHNGNCWKPCAAAISAVMNDESEPERDSTITVLIVEPGKEPYTALTIRSAIMFGVSGKSSRKRPTKKKVSREEHARFVI